MRGFRWTLINDESVTSFAATPWIPKKSYAFFTTKNRSLSWPKFCKGVPSLGRASPIFMDGAVFMCGVRRRM